eukprot:CAMPEP_0205813864 /NCGR_PEP_ID=MMETSP0205-20121125/18663_1 /ASSEMBLY_ACC=CAM_ASM_000278 /TAXON_ID=36767 /ORGANISM="Euplotes focardii, Strain TN1" /LENGTH=81 /DNA_ID=CAMNT_0053096659 /DNA_START=196 /DNA_END=439 /DNA_ORIENTATION=-
MNNIRTLNNLFQNRDKGENKAIMVEFAKNSESDENEIDEIGDDIDSLILDKFDDNLQMKKHQSYMPSIQRAKNFPFGKIKK